MAFLGLVFSSLIGLVILFLKTFFIILVSVLINELLYSIFGFRLDFQEVVKLISFNIYLIKIGKKEKTKFWKIFFKKCPDFFLDIFYKYIHGDVETTIINWIYFTHSNYLSYLRQIKISHYIIIFIFLVLLYINIFFNFFIKIIFLLLIKNYSEIINIFKKRLLILLFRPFSTLWLIYSLIKSSKNEFLLQKNMTFSIFILSKVINLHFNSTQTTVRRMTLDKLQRYLRIYPISYKLRNLTYYKVKHFQFKEDRDFNLVELTTTYYPVNYDYDTFKNFYKTLK